MAAVAPAMTITSPDWAYHWNTAKIENQIKEGTYLVYVTNEPVDKANLGGSSSYKTLEVYLTESTTARVSTGSGTTYTLNPEMHSSVHVPTLAITSPTPTPTPVTTPPTPVPVTTTPLPTTKAPLLPITSVLAMLLITVATLLKKK